MSSAADSSIDSLVTSLEKFKPNETKTDKKAKKAKGKKPQTVVQDGMISPGATPGPDPARNEADEKRTQEEAEQAANDDNSSFAITKPPNPSVSDAEDGDDATRNDNNGDATGESSKGKEVRQVIKDAGNKETVSKEKETGKGKEASNEAGGKKDWTDEQEEVVQRVMKTRDGFNYEILDLSGPKDESKVNSAWKNLALKTHPDKNKHPRAKDAFESK